jgi:nicotinamidase-related amidase
MKYKNKKSPTKMLAGKIKKISLLLLLTITIIACKKDDFDGIIIGTYDDPQKALLVMDMQLDALGENAKMPIVKSQIVDLINTVNAIIDDYSEKGYKIIYIKTVFPKNSKEKGFIEGTVGIEIDPRVNIVSENIFVKNKSDAFSNKEFESFLISNQVNELYVTGLMAEGCVSTTVVAALKRNYTVYYI